MSAALLSGITPARDVSPIVERMPTRSLCADGPRMELPVSLPSPLSPSFEATAAAVPPLEPAVPRSRAGGAGVPPLEPAVTRSSAYGFLVYPGRIELTVSYGVNAHSAMFDLAS